METIFGRIENKHKLTFNLYQAIELMLCDRLNDPLSKLSSYNYQEEYFGIKQVKLHHLYRALDKMCDYQNLIQKHIYEQNKTLFNYEVDLVFYDVTTFYFDSDKEKEGQLRQKGYGKDGKIGKTQVVFGMLIDRNKNPIGYRVYKGSQYEGHTFKDAIKQLRKEYDIKEVVIVAGSGMMNKENLKLFGEDEIGSDYSCIVGERLRNLTEQAKQYLTNLSHCKTVKHQNEQGEEISLQYSTYEYKGRCS